MKALSVLTFSLLLAGAGCARSKPELQLPTTPPETPAVMEPKVEDGTMMKKDEGAMMPKTEDGTMMKKDEGAMMPKTEDGTMMKKDEGAMMPAKQPYYIAYTADGVSKAMAEGRPVVLYFYAAWCPICRAEDPNIKSWIEASSIPVAGFRVDFDTEKAMKEKYRIPYQHTTVFLTAGGAEVERFTGPMSQTDFEAAFAKASK